VGHIGGKITFKDFPQNCPLLKTPAKPIFENFVYFLSTAAGSGADLDGTLVLPQKSTLPLTIPAHDIHQSPLHQKTIYRKTPADWHARPKNVSNRTNNNQ